MDQKVSVVMPCYNNEKYIKHAISSILNQTYKNIELIIIDDGSTDRTLQIINQFNDHRIKIYKIKHSGLSKALNFGINKSTGNYIARMDADDIALNDRIKKQLSFCVNNYDVDLLGCSAFIINENGNIIGEKNMPSSNKFIKKNLQLNCCIIHPTYFFKKSLFEKIDGYREQFLYAQDYDFLLRANNKNFKLVNLREKLIKYRVYSSMNIIKKYNQMRYTRLAQKLYCQNKLYKEEKQQTISQSMIYIDKLDNLLLIKHYLFYYFNSKRISKTFPKLLWVCMSYIISLFDKELLNITYKDTLEYFRLKKYERKN